MLEEALNNPNGSPPEAALALLSFFRQEFPLGGTSAEARFVHFFPILLERVFGPVIANSLSCEHEFTAEDLKVIEKTWLLYSRSWRTVSSATGPAKSLPYSPHSNQSSTQKPESDPVIKLLSTPKPVLRKSSSTSQPGSTQQTTGKALSFFQILSCPSDLELHILRNAQTTFPFVELPLNVQKAFARLAKAQTSGMAPGQFPHSVKSNSAERLLDCLSIKPIQQKELMNNIRHIVSTIQYGQGSNPVHSPNASIHSPIFSPMNQQFSPQKATSPRDIHSLEKSLKLNISLWEYYFLVFCRFPLLMGKMIKATKKSSSSSSSGFGYSKKQSSSTYGEKVYQYLLRDYINYYFPHNFDESGKIVSTTPQNDPEDRKSEVLFRLMIEYWFERHVYTTTKDALVHISSESGLDKSYDLSQLLTVGNKWDPEMGNRTSQRYEAPPKQAQRGMRLLVDHLICDPAVRWRNYVEKGKRVKDVGNGAVDKYDWSMPETQTILQPSLFNYIRTALRYGPIHTTNSSFYSAMDLWLMWLEPWNVVQRKKTGGATTQAKELFNNVYDGVAHLGGPAAASSRQKAQHYSVYMTPKPNQASKYTPEWESYIAANLHFYLVPLAIFLHRGRELDFTKSYFQKSMNHLQRVIRVFSPKVLQTINTLLDNKEGHEYLDGIIETHEDNLGEFCPQRSGAGDNKKMWNLEMLQEEMHNLLEEIVLQHRKTIGEQDVFERMFARLEGLFGEGSKAEEIAISKLTEKAKLIVRFPQDYKVVPNLKRKDGFFRGFSNLTATDNEPASTDIYSPERERGGFVTEQGRKQILQGSRICNAMDITFLGDPLYARPKSYEIEVLVKWTILLSNKLNTYFGLDVARQSSPYCDKKTSTAEQLAREGEEMNKVGLFRFNLRFLADSRNWFTMMLTWKIMCWLFRCLIFSN